MWRLIRKILAVALATLCAGAPLAAHAAKKKAASSPVAAIAAGTFRVLGWDGVTTDLYYFQGSKKVPVAVSPFAKSKPYVLPKGGVLNFYRDSQDAGGNTQSESIGGVSLDPGWKFPLILVTPIEAQPGKFTLSASNDDPANFPAGSIRLTNATGDQVIAKLSGTEIAIAPQESETVDLRATALQVVDVSLSVDLGETHKPVYERGWEIDHTMRVSAFIIKDADGRYRVRHLRESLPEKK